jgi:hypothetical protein
MTTLSPDFAVRTGARKIALGACNLIKLVQATVNNTPQIADREALQIIKSHLSAAENAARALQQSVEARSGA